MKVDPRKRPRRYGWVISQVFISHVAHTKRDRRNRRTFMKRDREKRRTSMKRDLEKRRTSMKRDLWQWPIAMSIDPRKRPRRHEYVMSLKFRSHVTLMKRDRRKRRTSMKRELRKRPVSMKIDARKTPRRCVKWLKEFLFFSDKSLYTLLISHVTHVTRMKRARREGATSMNRDGQKRPISVKRRWDV